MATLSELVRRFDGQAIPHCPGRYVLRGIDATEGPETVVGSDGTVTEHTVVTARDRVVVTRLGEWGLISYARAALGTATLRPIEDPVLELDLEKAAGPYNEGVQMVKLRPYERYVGDFQELAAAIRGDKPIAVTPEEDLMVQEALIEASGM